MMNKEQLPATPERAHDTAAIHEAATEGHERIAEQLHENLEKHNKSDIESTKREALENAASIEKSQETEQRAHEKSPAPKQRTSTKTARKTAFDNEMRQVQSHLSPASRTFSKVIHNPAIEKTSEVVGSTVARPNAILSGAVFAFVLTLGVYLIARFFGYPLSGSESISAFVLGWVIGCLYDFLRVMITGKKA